MVYNFKDERIKFCLETYANFSMGKMFLHNVFENMPIEVINAINIKENKSIRCGKNKYCLTFNKSRVGNFFDSFILTVQKGSNIYSIKVFYSYYSSDIEKCEDTNKTILFAEHKVQKGLFTQPKREFSQYAFINKEGNVYTVKFIDDVKHSISNGFISVDYTFVNRLKKLKSQKEYNIQDKKTYEQVNGKSR